MSKINALFQKFTAVQLNKSQHLLCGHSVGQNNIDFLWNVSTLHNLDILLGIVLKMLENKPQSRKS